MTEQTIAVPARAWMDLTRGFDQACHRLDNIGAVLRAAQESGPDASEDLWRLLCVAEETLGTAHRNLSATVEEMSVFQRPGKAGEASPCEDNADAAGYNDRLKAAFDNRVEGERSQREAAQVAARGGR